MWLDELSRPGLGAHLYHALQQRCAVVGVAKGRFFTGSNVAELVRGRSHKPLFITSTGIDLEVAAQSVRSMHGKDRLPTLPRMVDRLSRGIESS